MTQEQARKFRTVRHWIKEAGAVIGALAVIISTAIAVWAYTVGPVRDVLDQAKWVLETMEYHSAAIARNTADIRTLQGEDRVIREVPGMTYVEEPVYVGDRVIFNFTAERTTLGAPCILLRSIPVYIDERNIPFPGPARVPAQQIGTDPRPLQIGYEMPADLRPGRIVMHVVLEYECNGRFVPDQTSSVAFLLQDERNTE